MAQFNEGPKMTMPGKGEGTVYAGMSGKKGYGVRSKIVKVDSPKTGDRIRSGGKTHVINMAMARTSGGVTTADVVDRKLKPFGDQREAKIKAGSVIFRWIGGHVVPIKVG